MSKLYKGDMGEGNNEQIMSKANWKMWFDINGNHDFDGWQDAEDWWEDMIARKLIVEV